MTAELSISELARRIGVSRQTASVWERTGRIDDRHYPTLAKALRVSESYLTHGEAPPIDPARLIRAVRLVMRAETRMNIGLEELQRIHAAARVYGCMGADQANPGQIESAVREAALAILP